MTIGLKLGAERFSKWIDRFGFGRRTGVQYPDEEIGLVPKLDEYSGSTMGNLPMGQGLSVTPMQMMAGYQAIADGGILKRPQLIEKVGEEKVDEPIRLHRAFLLFGGCYHKNHKTIPVRSRRKRLADRCWPGS